jgi:hypothetical protein
VREFGARVEVQRVLLGTLALWLFAGASLGDPAWLVLARAAGAVLWTFLLAWSFTVDSPVARAGRVAAGAAVVTGCAASFGASPESLLLVAAAAGALLVAAERIVAAAAPHRGAPSR